MDAWIVFAATMAAIGAITGIFALIRQTIRSRPKIIVKVYKTGIYGEDDLEKYEIRVNIRNLKQRTIKILGAAFFLSNGHDFYPKGWNVPVSLSHGFDHDYVVDIDELKEQISEEYPGATIKSVFFEEAEDGKIHYVNVPKSIKNIISK